MKEKDKWAKRLNEKMEGYTEPLPEGLWERLESELPSPHVIPMWKSPRLVAAVAAVALVAVVSLTFWLKDAGREDALPALSALSGEHEVPGAPSVVENPFRPGAERVEAKPVQVPVMAALVSREALPEPSVLPVEEMDTLSGVEARTEQVEVEVVPQPAAEERKNDRRLADREQMRRNSAVLAETKKREGRSWAVALNAGNTPYSSSSTFNGAGRLYAQAASVAYGDAGVLLGEDGRAAYSQVLLNSRDQVSTTDVHHKMPVTVGASLKWHLTPAWAIETGLSYTLLASDLRTGTDTYLEEEQKLHYVGIPLKVHRAIYDNRWLSLYASAGGMVEKCVSASQDVSYVSGMSGGDQEHYSLDIDELQWSLSAAAGVQLNLTRQLGVYAEPGIVYYFDDGSGVETIRKEHPFNFNLQVGLRYSFK